MQMNTKFFYFENWRVDQKLDAITKSEKSLIASNCSLKEYALGNGGKRPNNFLVPKNSAMNCNEEV